MNNTQTRTCHACGKSYEDTVSAYCPECVKEECLQAFEENLDAIFGPVVEVEG